MTKINVALVQMYPKLGLVQANLDQHLAWIEQAQKEDADLILFPELSLTGYSLQDLTADVAIPVDTNHAVLQPLLQASQKLDMVVSFVEADSRQRFYNVSAYLSKGELVHVHRKVYLPTYGMFDERRFFAAGNSVGAFDTQFGRVGMLICEDFWHVSLPYLLWMDGAEILLFLSASPGRGLADGKQLATAQWVERIIQVYASLFTSFVLHVNRIGFEDGLHFWGTATAFDPAGRQIIQGPNSDPALVMAELELGQLRRTRAQLPLLRDERIGLMQREITRLVNTLEANRNVRREP